MIRNGYGTIISGLVGEYCWVVSLRNELDVDVTKTVSIHR